MSDDHDLLRRYAARETDAQDAFATLVRRHVDLVYSVARRTVRSPQLAEEVAQSVFIDLARNARTIRTGTPLVAWLHLVSRRTAIDAVRRETRRWAREAEAAIVSDDPAMKSYNAPWDNVAPLLDEAVDSLAPAERNAILLRYFENKSLREVGSALGISDDTAQKRVSRAVDRLRTFFLRRGISVTAAGLACDLPAHAILTAPAALGGFITSAVLSGSTGAIAPVVVMSVVQKILGAAAAVALLGVALHWTLTRSVPHPPVLVATQPTPPDDPASAQGPARPVPAAARPADTLDQRVAILRQLLIELPAQRLPEIELLTVSDWIEIAHAHELDTAADIRLALADLRAVARRKFAAQLQEALHRFTSASGGQLPSDITQLNPHLTAPADAEMLARYNLLRAGQLGDPSEELLREKSSSDMLLSVGLDSWNMKNNPDLPPAFGESNADALDRVWRALGTAMPDETRVKMASLISPGTMSELMESTLKIIVPIFGDEDAFGDALKNATRDFIAAHPGETATNFAQILPFLKNSDKLAAALRPAFAQLEYLREHAGRPPTDPAELHPYLAKPFDATEALDSFKLKWDGEHLTVSLNWGTQ